MSGDFPIPMRWGQRVHISYAEIPQIAQPGLGKVSVLGTTRGPFFGPQGPRVLLCIQPNIYLAEIYWAPTVCWAWRNFFNFSDQKWSSYMDSSCPKLIWKAHSHFMKRKSEHTYHQATWPSGSFHQPHWVFFFFAFRKCSTTHDWERTSWTAKQKSKFREG